MWLDFTRATIFYKPGIVLENGTDLSKRQSRGFAETFAKNWLYEKITLPEKHELGEKARTKLAKTFAEKNVADFRNLTLPRET